MATRVRTAATLNPPLLTLSSSSSPIQPVSSARRSLPWGRLRLRSRRPRSAKFVCRRAKDAAYDHYKFPDPIPKFAEHETSKFKEHMTWRPAGAEGGGVLRRARGGNRRHLHRDLRGFLGT